MYVLKCFFVGSMIGFYVSQLTMNYRVDQRLRALETQVSK